MLVLSAANIVMKSVGLGLSCSASAAAQTKLCILGHWGGDLAYTLARGSVHAIALPALTLLRGTCPACRRWNALHLFAQVRREYFTPQTVPEDFGGPGFPPKPK